MSMRCNAVSSAGLRDWMNQNSALVTVGAVALLIIAIVAVVIQMRPDGIDPPDQAFFYVPETKEMFAAEAKMIPPIDRNGKPAFKAHVYGCGDCDDPNRFTAYYEKYTDAGKAQLDKLREQMASTGDPEGEIENQIYEISMTQRFFSTDAAEWVLAESPQGQALQETVREKCGTAKLTYCSP